MKTYNKVRHHYAQARWTSATCHVFCEAKKLQIATADANGVRTQVGSTFLLDEEFIFDGDITDDVIRKWAYDENMWLCEQDEDLLLGSKEYFPVLFELAEDSDCPKGGYALTIMDFYLMFQILRGNNSSISLVQEAIEYCKNSNRENVLEWMKILEKRIEFKLGVKNVSKELALEMGQVLLNGISRESDISIINETTQEWVVELSVPPFHRHKERLYINKESGIFRFER